MIMTEEMYELMHDRRVIPESSSGGSYDQLSNETKVIENKWCKFGSDVDQGGIREITEFCMGTIIQFYGEECSSYYFVGQVESNLCKWYEGTS